MPQRIQLSRQRVLPTRASGGRGYNSSYRYGVIKHAPTDDLVDPCPWHAWKYIGPRGDGAGCLCGWAGYPVLLTAANRWADAT